MLTPPQKQTLTQLVFAQLGVNPSTQDVSVWVGEQAVGQLPTAARVLQVAEWIVATVLDQPTPKDLIRVIRAADNHQPGFESLLELARRLDNDPDAWVPSRRSGPDDWALDSDPLTVPDGGPFLDRLRFRQLLPRVGEKLSMPTCMLVRGDTGSGKSYLQDFCKGFAARRKDFVVGYTRLGSSGLKDFSPRIPSMELATGLRTDLSKAPAIHEDQYRDARNLAAWLTAYTPRQQVPGLAILDDFGAAGLNEAVHTFVLELIRLVQSDERVAQKIRIVLLGYDAERLSREKLQYELHVLEHVDIKHIDQWLRLRFPDHPEYRYKGAVDALSTIVPDAGVTRLRMLNLWVSMISEQFKTAAT